MELQTKRGQIKGDTSTIVVVAVLSLILIAGVVFILKTTRQQNSAVTSFSTPPTSMFVSSSPSPVVSANPTVSNGDNSNAALDQDMQSIGNNLNSLNSESSSADQGINQKATDPTQ